MFYKEFLLGLKMILGFTGSFGVGLIIHVDKEAVNKYLKYFIILYTLVGTKN